MVIEIQKISSIFAYKAGLVRIHVDFPIAKSIGIVLRRVSNIEFILVSRIRVLIIDTLLELLFINTYLDLS